MPEQPASAPKDPRHHQATTRDDTVTTDVMTRPPKQRRWLLLKVFLAAAAIGIFVSWGYISAFVNYLNSSAEMQRASASLSLTLEGSAMLWRQSPQFTSAATLQQNCGAIAQGGHLAGCWIRNDEYPQGKILLLGSLDPDVQTEITVATAHEMLHAAYDSLSDSERSELVPVLRTQLSSRQDEWFRKAVQPYAGDDQLSEAFAVLGTQAADLPFVLKETYGKYFKNRHSVVASSHRLEAEAAAIEELKRAADKKLHSGDYDGYNAEVSSINAKIDHLNRVVDKVNAYLGAG